MQEAEPAPRAASVVLLELRTDVPDPAHVASAVTALVRASLDGRWRAENSSQEVLESLADLIELHLAALAGEIPEVGGEDDGSRAHEKACTSCLKLARNLCVGSSRVQAYWWTRGLVQKLAEQTRNDLAVPGGSRNIAWRDAVPTFVSNVVADNPDLRSRALTVLFPYGLSAVCALSWKRPEHAFMLTQNLTAGEAGAVEQLVETEEGHCLLYVLLSFLRGREDSRENELSAQAQEWASVFFNTLWLAGGFPAAYRGITGLSASQLHSFLAAASGVGTQGGTETWSWSRPPLSIGFWRLMEGLCGHAEAGCLLWHTIHGLLAGPGADAEDRGASKALAKELLGDASFVELAADVMVSSLALLARQWDLDWQPSLPSAEACEALGLAPEEVADLLGKRELQLQLQLQADSPPEAEALPEAEGAAAVVRPPSTLLFEESLQAAVALSAVPRGASDPFPPRLLALYLNGNVAFIDALHRLRFGEVRTEAPQRASSSPGASEAAQRCRIVDQIRLCGNLLYEQPQAQAFLRLTGGLRVLLSHCYSDHEVPMLREAGIFAVRNALHGSEANQASARATLAGMQTAAAAGERLVEDLGLV